MKYECSINKKQILLRGNSENTKYSAPSYLKYEISKNTKCKLDDTKMKINPKLISLRPKFIFFLRLFYVKK